MKRVKYEVHHDKEVAKFSCLWHALLFGASLSDRLPGWLIEVSAKDGLVGQYKGGNPTPEFKQHHINGMFR